MSLVIRREFFTFGIIHVDVLNLSSVDLIDFSQKLAKKLILQQQTKLSAKDNAAGKSSSVNIPYNYATFHSALKYSLWLPVAQLYFNCTQNQAKLYFETFLLIHNRSHQHKPIQTSATSKDLHNKLLLSVDFSEFVLFLFLQQFRSYYNANKGSKICANLPDLSSKTIALAYEFLQANLSTILLLVRDAHKQSLPFNPLKLEEISLEQHEFNRLKFIFTALNPENSGKYTEIHDFADLTTFWQGNSIGKGVKLPQLVSFLQKLLKLSYNSAEKFTFPYNNTIHSTPTVNKVEGSLLYPLFPNFHTLSGLSDRSVALTAAEILGGDVILSDCKEVCVGISTFSRFILLENCSDSIFYLGTAANLVILSNCRQLTVISATKSLQIIDSSHCRVYCYTVSRPICLQSAQQSNQAIVLAPYNSYYNGLLSDCALANLNIYPNNCFSMPILIDQLISSPEIKQNAAETKQTKGNSSLTSDRFQFSPSKEEKLTSSSALPTFPSSPQRNSTLKSPRSHSTPQNSLHSGARFAPFVPATPSSAASAQISQISVLPPDYFFPAVYPFPIDAVKTSKISEKLRGLVDFAHNFRPETLSNPFPLPENYSAALKTRANNAMMARKMIDEAELNQEEKHEFQAVVEEKFRNWLAANYPQQYITNLLRYDIENFSLQQPKSLPNPSDIARNNVK
jgi:hypothetical protein